ncbi:MAG: fatty acid desaturase [Bacteroidetes bacterium]|nr:fatty acid desaturase [Bacteroidota bacterium]
MDIPLPAYRYRGLLVAGVVIAAWVGALVYSLTLDLSAAHWVLIPLFMLLNTFLYTGLFITAHDAMHGTVAPKHQALNRAIGRTVTLLYALFSFDMLLKKHREHHRHPAGEGDPDFHDGEHGGFLRWYVHFFFTYVTWKQILGMAIVYNVLLHLAGVANLNLILFWALPAILSTSQLFYFGTYLPHREPPGGYEEPHRARSNDYGVALSFLTCYHFGYHYEHHAWPYVPWWNLPAARRENREPKTE